MNMYKIMTVAAVAALALATTIAPQSAQAREGVNGAVAADHAGGDGAVDAIPCLCGLRSDGGGQGQGGDGRDSHDFIHVHSLQVTWLVDDLNDAARARINQHGMVVDVGVAVAGDVIIGRYVVISDADFGQFRANAEFAVVAIGRMALAHDVFAKARTVLDAENAADRADRGTDGATDDGANRTGGPIARSRAFLRAAYGALR